MRKKKPVIAAILLSAFLLGGCGGQNSVKEPPVQESGQAPEDSSKALPEAEPEKGVETSETEPETGAKAELADGVYTAEFDTDSSMFHVSEACDGKGTLTVENGKMTIHISLMSKKILNLYPGLAEDAQKEGAKLLMPTEDTVTYSDGMTEEVYGFDVPVPALEEEFDLALVGTKGTWYDHKVSVSNPVPAGDEPADKAGTEDKDETESKAKVEDGTYTIELTFEGGSGKARILSPATITVAGEEITATVQWSSPNYDYMLVDGKKYLPVNTEGNSVFEIPVSVFDEPMDVIGDTLAMSTPHEVEYTLTFHSDTMVFHTKESPSMGKAYQGSMELQYAENFAVDYYEGGYTLLTTTMDGARFLIVPEGEEVSESVLEGISGENSRRNSGKNPPALEREISVLQRPVKDIYLVASSAMDIFSRLGGLNAITFSGQKEEGWYIEKAREAMRRGDILYAGKYNKPDYERIVSGNCSLAIENMMISHAPEVMEKLEDFGIPVMIEYSSYESHPLGRVEWVKFFGALLGKEEEAEKIFEEQAAILERVAADEKTDRTVAFFFITSNGLVQVRQSSDYVPKMIELAGGRYIFENLGGTETKRSTMNMQVEEFYSGAKDADFLIYNSSIDGGILSVEELLDKCASLADFRAVKEGNVWCTTNDMYQQSLSIGYLIEDIHGMLRGEKDGMHYLFHVS